MYTDMAALEGISLKGAWNVATAPVRWVKEHPKAALAVGGAIVATGAIIATGGTASPIVGAAMGAGKFLGGAALTGAKVLGHGAVAVGRGAFKAGEAVASVIPMPEGTKPSAASKGASKGGGKAMAMGGPSSGGKGIWLFAGIGLVAVGTLLLMRPKKRRRK